MGGVYISNISNTDFKVIFRMLLCDELNAFCEQPPATTIGNLKKVVRNSYSAYNSQCGIVRFDEK